MSVISYSTFRSQLRRWGVTFIEHSRYDRCVKRSVPWYQHEARRYSDCARRGWDARGIAIHHTGGPTAWTFVWDGRLSERIPGPLYTVEVYEDGVAHLTGWGVSNNVGTCDRAVRDRALAGKMPTSGEVRPGPDSYSAANSEFYGLAYRGTTRNSKQRATMLRICAAICEAHGKDWDGGSIAGHRELTRRKPDPAGEHMGHFRADVNKLLASPPASTSGGSTGITIPPSTTPTVPGITKDWFDMATQADLEAALRKVLNEEVTTYGLADSTLPDDWNRRRDRLLGYAAMTPAPASRARFAADVHGRLNPTLGLQYGSIARFMLNAIRPDKSQTPGARVGFLQDLDRIEELQKATLAAAQGLDESAVMAAVDAHHAERKADAERADAALQVLVERVDEMAAAAERRDAELGTLVGEALSGERDATEVLRALRDLIDTAVGDDAPS